MLNTSIDIKKVTIELMIDSRRYSFKSEKTFWEEKTFKVISDDDRSYPLMNSDDIYTCRAGYPGDFPFISTGQNVSIKITANKNTSAAFQFQRNM